MSAYNALGITLRQIRAFIAVAHEGSFTRAADSVGITQPALTTCIRQLEERSGLSLFDRTTRSVVLNRFGREFLPVAERIVRDLDAALDAMHRLKEGEYGTLALATVPSIASSLLPSTLGHFSVHNPNVGITISEDHSEGVRRKVQEGEVEFGLSGITEPFADVEIIPLFYDDVGLFCSAHHELAHLDRPLRWADLAGMEIFNMGYQTQIQAIIDVVPEVAISLSSTSYKVRNVLTTLSLIRGHNTIAALPRLSIPPDALTDVVFLPLSEPELRRDIFLCRHPRTVLSPAAQKLIASIRISAARAGACLYEVPVEAID